MKQARKTKPVLYVVHTVTEDWMLGNKEEYVLRQIRKPLVGIPYACKVVGSFEEGARFCEEHGFRPVFLEERHHRSPDGVFEWGEPVEVKPEVTSKAAGARVERGGAWKVTY